MQRVRLRVLAALVITAALAFLVLRQIDLQIALRAVLQARRLELFIAFLFLVAAYAGRAGRWLVWDPSLGFRESAKAVLVGFMGNNVLPARLGEVLRADRIARRSPLKYGRTSALASIVAERVLDGAFLSVLAGVSLLFVTVNTATLAALTVITAVFGLLACALVVAIVSERGVRTAVDRLNQLFPGHLTHFAREKAHFALDGMLRLRGRTRLLAATAATAGIWLLELACFYTVAAAIFGIPLSVAAILVTVVNFASLFPGTVGGIGAIEAAATVFLVSTGVPSDQAFAIVIVQHAYQLAFTTIVGAMIFVADRRRADTDVATSDRAVAQAPDDIVDRTRSTLDVMKSDFKLKGASDRFAVFLSIVIPAYNERQRLPLTALETIRWCNLHRLRYEIIVVDDGSTDDTLSIGELLEHHDRHVRTLACPHKGKGAAVRMGMLNAHGHYVLFMDADGATPLTEIPRLLEAIESGYDVAIGSRVQQHPGEITVETSWHRRVIGRVFALFVNVFAVTGIADTQCGFKMFRHGVIRQIFSQQRLDGFAFDVELLYIARHLGISIAEIPVNWQNKAGSKVNLAVDSIKMLWDLTHIRWMHRHFTAVRDGAAASRPQRAAV